jgi:hypothetical protein
MNLGLGFFFQIAASSPNANLQNLYQFINTQTRPKGGVGNQKHKNGESLL